MSALLHLLFAIPVLVYVWFAWRLRSPHALVMAGIAAWLWALA
jgi:hypothetical protein